MQLPGFHWWRTVFFLIPTIAIYTVALGTLSVLSSVLDRRGYFAHGCARLWAWLILATTGVIVSTEGIGRVDRKKTYVFVSNHQSIYDIPVVFAWLPFQLRIIAKESLGRVPFLGWHLRRTGHLLVDRRSPDRAGILRRWKGLVGEGLSLIVFPEGTRSADGRVGAFKAGSFLLAIEAGLPVVPLTVVGSRSVMTRGQLTTRPGRVRLVVHEPIVTTALDPSAARELAERVREIVSSPLAGHQASDPTDSPRSPGETAAPRETAGLAGARGR